MSDEHEFEVWQDGGPVAWACGADREAVWREARHYASQYGQDGPVEVFEVRTVRIPVDISRPQSPSDGSETTKHDWNGRTPSSLLTPPLEQE